MKRFLPLQVEAINPLHGDDILGLVWDCGRVINDLVRLLNEKNVK
jgi:hypothetical protein